MPSAELKIRDVTPTITTFSTPFNRFAPFGYRRFVAVGNRATAIRLHDNQILLLNPIQLENAVRDKLNRLGGVHLILEAKTIGVPGLDSKRKDVNWNYIYKDWRTSPEDQFDFAQDFETVLFEGFITYCVAWYHKPTKTLIQLDLMMNLLCTEQYYPSSSDQGPLSHEFAKRAHPRSIWAKRLVYYIATVDYTLMRRDAKKVAEWQIDQIILCHGDILESGGNEAWLLVYKWFLKGTAKPSVMKRLINPIMKVARRVFLM
ncbi:unnamed protein product [Alternaria alternata]